MGKSHRFRGKKPLALCALPRALVRVQDFVPSHGYTYEWKLSIHHVAMDPFPDSSTHELIKFANATSQELFKEQAWREASKMNFSSYRAQDMFIGAKISTMDNRPLLRSTERFLAPRILQRRVLSSGPSARALAENEIMLSQRAARNARKSCSLMTFDVEIARGSTGPELVPQEVMRPLVNHEHVPHLSGPPTQILLTTGDKDSTTDKLIATWSFATMNRFHRDRAAHVVGMLQHVAPVCKTRSFKLVIRNFSTDVQFWISDRDTQLATVEVAVADEEVRVRKRGRRGGRREQAKRARGGSYFPVLRSTWVPFP